VLLGGEVIVILLVGAISFREFVLPP
jgi:hypothetical protein